MHTTKGTHIDHPKKRCNRCPVCFALITIVSWACVCTPHPIRAQDSNNWSSTKGVFVHTSDRTSYVIGQPYGRYWFISGIERSFGLKELDEPWVHLGLKRSRTSVSIGGRTIGWSQMRQFVADVSAHYAVGGIIAGIETEYWVLQLRKPYSNDRAVVVRSNIQKTIWDDVHLATSVQNVFGSNWMVGGDPIERMVDVDLFYSPHPNLLMIGGMSVSDQFPIDYRGRLSWKPHDILAVSLGVGTMPSRIEMGIRIDRKGLLSGIGFTKVTNEPIGWRQNYWFGMVLP